MDDKTDVEAVRKAVEEAKDFQAKRLIDWANGGKPAITAFTAGELRQVAYAVEDKVRRAVEEFRMKCLEIFGKAFDENWVAQDIYDAIALLPLTPDNGDKAGEK